ncbi:hypothetical protein SXYLSMQ121_1955 [Staphylococcus xylosus]|nr:hypothetical protein SXYLSMQ121_1955 [Staphylococcus xylosus]
MQLLKTIYHNNNLKHHSKRKSATHFNPESICLYQIAFLIT